MRNHSRTALPLCLVLALAFGSACADRRSRAGSARARLYDLAGRDPIGESLFATPKRLNIVYWPKLDACQGCQFTMREALAKLISKEGDPDDFRIVSVVSSSSAHKLRESGHLPGTVIDLPDQDYSRLARFSPTPRIEVWDASGRLLLFKSVPMLGDAVAATGEEIFHDLGFTRPIAERESEGSQ